VELRSIEFCREHLGSVQDFQCGSAGWAMAAADWIKAAPPFDGALLSIEKYHNKVWLHFIDVPPLNESFLVGFSSLGLTKMPVPYPDGSRRHVQYIPMLAVASAFQGKAIDDSGRKYSVAIMEHVLAAAGVLQPRDLCLLVHADNLRAISLYSQFGFEVIGEPDGRKMLRMLKRLD
jgi:ribosomal protein S18 acetylase RimI-like enzyme